MKKTFASVALLCGVGLIVAGCGCGVHGADDGVKSSLTDAESRDHDIAVVVGGDWKKLTAEQKAKFIKDYGNEQTAKAMLQRMAHPPNGVSAPKPKA